MHSEITPQIRQKILQSTNSVVELRPLGVVLAIDGSAEVLREPHTASVQNQYIVVDVKTGKPEVSGREVLAEGAMTAINCTAAVVAGIVTLGGGAGAPFSGGASLAVSTVAGAATLATALSCGNSSVRTINALFFPGENQVLDNMPSYKTTLQVLDGVSLLGVGASAFAARRAIKVLSNAGVNIPAALTGHINRQQAALLTKEMIKLRRPNVSNGELKKLIRSGKEPKRYSRQEISLGALKSLKDSIAAGLSFLSSTLDGNIKEISIYIVELAS
ncbi:MAG: hypothetical protein CMN90_05120 [Sutterellaceae bacterium]|nr:hypothetical protein [Sutterellaceae bacterium]|tara:strand:- start:7367 stop:8188 length:822 start_codon:yes stop_codon:yes gene_type:complete